MKDAEIVTKYEAVVARATKEGFTVGRKWAFDNLTGGSAIYFTLDRAGFAGKMFDSVSGLEEYLNGYLQCRIDGLTAEK